MANVELITDCNKIQELLPFWEQHGRTPLQRPQWQLAAWDAYRTPNQHLAIVVMRDQGQCIGIAPFCISNQLLLGSTIRFLGGGKVCSDYQTVISQAGDEHRVATILFDWLFKSADAPAWNLMELSGVDPDDTFIKAFLALGQQNSTIVHSTELDNTWRIDLTTGWDGYLQTLSKSGRRHARAALRTVEGSDFHLRTIAESGQLEEGFQILVDLHQARWRAAGLPGCFTDPRFTTFLKQAFGAYLNQGQARLLVLEHAGKPVAVHCYLQDAKRMYLYQVGRDPEFDHLSVGRLLNIAAIHQFCNDGMEVLDFLRGNEEYKSRLAAVPSTNLRLRIVRRAPIPVLQHQAWLWARSVKHQVTAMLRPKATEPASKETELSESHPSSI